MSLDLFTSAQLSPGPAAPKPRPSIEERFASWSLANQHVLDELLRLAREQLARGATFCSVKKLWEECRVSISRTSIGTDAAAQFIEQVEPYKLNNTYTACAARWLLEQEPRLVGVIEIRKTKP